MSFENIQLPPFLLQDLYKKDLIDCETEAVSSDVLQGSAIEALGTNKKNILILLQVKGRDIIDKKELTFLEGVLKACNLIIEDVSIVNLHHCPQVAYTDLVSKFSPSIVLLFGAEPSEIRLPLHFPHNQIQQHISQQYVSFPPLSLIAQERPLKQALWATLQKLFNLN